MGNREVESVTVHTRFPATREMAEIGISRPQDCVAVVLIAYDGTDSGESASGDLGMDGDRGGGERQGPGRQGGGRPGGKPVRKLPPRTGPIGLRQIPGTPDGYDLVHPRCVEETELDYAEGIELWKAGDPEEARDALRFALQGCHDNLWVHTALGRIALQEFKDPNLARGHFGYAVELVRKSLPPGFSGRIPRDRPANRPYFDAVEGLVECLRALGRGPEADRLASFGERPRGDPAGPGKRPPPPGRRTPGNARD
jgi:hypothetical protein